MIATATGRRNTLGSNEFLRILRGETKGEIRHGTVVQGPVTIGEEVNTFPLNSRFLFQDITFINTLTVRNIRVESVAIAFENCEFLEGLRLEQLQVRRISVRAGRAKYLTFSLSCSVIGACLKELTVDEELDLSGLQAKESLFLDGTYGSLRIFNDRTNERIATQYVRTNLPLAVLQFQLAQIPVYPDSSVVSEIADNFV